MENWLTSSLKIASLQKAKLTRDFYARHTLDVAQDLLGKVLVVKTAPKKELLAGRIVETEAYREGDPASHSARGATPRSSIMFGEPGHAYVYFIYGMYEMLNFVTEPKGQPGAVLIRALEPLSGLAQMQKRRPSARQTHELCNGPGKLCKAFGIHRSLNGAPLQGPKLWVIDDGYKVKKISKSSRIGISQGKELDWRFFITNHPCVSRTPQGAP